MDLPSCSADAPYNFGFQTGVTVEGTYPRVNVDKVIGQFVWESAKGAVAGFGAGLAIQAALTVPRIAAAAGAVAQTRIVAAVTEAIDSVAGTSPATLAGIGRILPDSMRLWHGTTTALLPEGASQLLPRSITGAPALNVDEATLEAEEGLVFAMTSRRTAGTYGLIKEAAFGGDALVVEVPATGFMPASDVIKTGEAGSLHPKAFVSRGRPPILSISRDPFQR